MIDTLEELDGTKMEVPNKAQPMLQHKPNLEPKLKLQHKPNCQSVLNSQSVPVELNWKLVPKEPNCREVFLQPNSVLQPMNIIPDSSVHDENQNSDILESADDFDQMESTMENTNEKCSEDEKSYFHLGCFIHSNHFGRDPTRRFKFIIDHFFIQQVSRPKRNVHPF